MSATYLGYFIVALLIGCGTPVQAAARVFGGGASWVRFFFGESRASACHASPLATRLERAGGPRLLEE